MVMESEDVVVVKVGKKVGEPTVVTVNCHDKTGLGCDICRTILEFDLRITRADVSTDGKWCYVVMWVMPRSASTNVRWCSLKNRLVSICPPSSLSSYFNLSGPPAESPVFLLKFFSVDRKGLLHDVTHVLSELEVLIHRVKVSTTPDGKVVDLIYITDCKELMHKKERRDELRSRLATAVGESCVQCELQFAASKFESFQQGYCSLPPAVVGELFNHDTSDSRDCLQKLSHNPTMTKRANINIDNSLSPSYTLLQINCLDQKGLLYDILRTLKDCNIQIAYGRYLSNTKGCREVDLFIHQNDRKKITDPEKQESLCSRLGDEMHHPLRVAIVNRGPDTELLVANPVELCGKGRPRVFYDVTLALKTLGICIFSAETGRYSTQERQWEVYRFLLEETPELPLLNRVARDQVVDTVRRTLMGWSETNCRSGPIDSSQNHEHRIPNLE